MPGQSGVGAGMGGRAVEAREKASRCLHFELTPACLNRWTSQEHLPHLLSDRSSASSSLCAQVERENGNLY